MTEIKEIVIRVQNAKEIRLIAEEDIIETGSTHLAQGAGKEVQLSPEWISTVSRNVGDSNLEKILKDAQEVQKLKTAVVGVNKGDGKVMLIPVMAENTNQAK